MSKNLKLIITEASNHCINLRRNVNIIVPHSLKTQAYAAFIKINDKNKWTVEHSDKKIKLSIGIMQSQGDIHYDTVYVVNPQDIEDKVLDEIKMIPTKDGLLVCVRL